MPTAAQLKNLASIIRPPGRKKKAAYVPPTQNDDDNYVGVGVGGLLAATEKLLAVNKGVAAPDERDDQKYNSILTADKLIRERIRMDGDKLRSNLVFRAGRTRSLKGIYPGMFDHYAEGFVVGHPLTAPLEEINPMHLVEQARRVTKMGPGGLSSDDVVDDGASNVHYSQFGFIDPIAGPESSRIGVDVRLANGVKIGSDGRLYQRFFDRRAKKLRWMSAVDLDGLTVKQPD